MGTYYENREKRIIQKHLEEMETLRKEYRSNNRTNIPNYSLNQIERDEHYETLENIYRKLLTLKQENENRIEDQAKIWNGIQSDVSEDLFQLQQMVNNANIKSKSLYSDVNDKPEMKSIVHEINTIIDNVRLDMELNNLLLKEMKDVLDKQTKIAVNREEEISNWSLVLSYLLNTNSKLRNRIHQLDKTSPKSSPTSTKNSSPRKVMHQLLQNMKTKESTNKQTKTYHIDSL